FLLLLGGRMMKNFFKWFSVFLLSLFSIIVSLAYYASNQIMYFKLREIEVIKRRETKGKRMDLKVLDGMPKDRVKIPSRFGYDINTTFYKPHQTDKWMIILHGVSENSLSSSKYVHMYTDMGFNSVVFDARRHGETGGEDSTYGHFEKYDLESVVNYFLTNYGKDLHFGVHGESMGAATVLLYAGQLKSKADFFISDASFARFSDQISVVFNSISKAASQPVLFFTYLLLKLRSKYSIFELSPIDVVDQIEQPILFIHTKRDKFIPYESSVNLYDKKQGPKQAWFPERGDHVESYNRNRKLYKQTVKEFIEHYAGW